MCVKSAYVNYTLHQLADRLEQDAERDLEEAEQYLRQAKDFSRSAIERCSKAKELRDEAGERIPQDLLSAYPPSKENAA